ncbi:NADAR family protein [Nonomuraea sp. NPDC049158]|uniref:NADAR family protein n=1 Tax=Nonomuraea sp. NPDC049158 TaxID=3155649 RepID=UPI0033D2FD39
MSDELPRTALPQTVAEAIAAEQAGQVLRYLFFWGHRPARDGGVGSGCLSQWWPVTFSEDGHTFASAEHYMMAHKAWLFDDHQTAAEILAAEHPGEAKTLGRAVRDFEEDVWNAHRFDIVVRGNLAKFAQHPDLADFLLGTRNRVLVEASPRDRIWGIGLTADDERAASPATWQGLNLLGFGLMSVRDALATAS